VQHGTRVFFQRRFFLRTNYIVLHSVLARLISINRTVTGWRLT
jgi:hypothetical protein